MTQRRRTKKSENQETDRCETGESLVHIATFIKSMAADSRYVIN